MIERSHEWPRNVLGEHVYCRYLSASERMRLGQSLISGGYRYLWAPMHPCAMSTGFISEHRAVAERTIGRLLAPGEVVHHLNENKLDNRPENLVVCGSRLEHIRRYHRREAA